MGRVCAVYRTELQRSQAALTRAEEVNTARGTAWQRERTALVAALSSALDQAPRASAEGGSSPLALVGTPLTVTPSGSAGRFSWTDTT
jgi:RecB family exonuclease